MNKGCVNLQMCRHPQTPCILYIYINMHDWIPRKNRGLARILPKPFHTSVFVTDNLQMSLRLCFSRRTLNIICAFC